MVSQGGAASLRVGGGCSAGVTVADRETWIRLVAAVSQRGGRHPYESVVVAPPARPLLIVRLGSGLLPRCRRGARHRWG